jgi:fibronectin-binding autotransporter adhesin
VGASGAQTLTGGSGTSAGNVVGALTVNGASTIAPGAPGARNTGIIAINNNFTLSSGAHLTLDLNGTVAGSSYDQVQANGTVTLAGDLNGLALGYTPAQGDVFYIILNNGSTTTGSLNNLAEGGVFNLGATAFKISYDSSHALGAAGFESGTGEDVALMVVPEPTTVATLLGGIGTLIGLQRFRRRRA